MSLALIFADLPNVFYLVHYLGLHGTDSVVVMPEEVEQQAHDRVRESSKEKKLLRAIHSQDYRKSDFQGWLSLYPKLTGWFFSHTLIYNSTGAVDLTAFLRNFSFWTPPIVGSHSVHILGGRIRDQRFPVDFEHHPSALESYHSLLSVAKKITGR